MIIIILVALYCYRRRKYTLIRNYFHLRPQKGGGDFSSDLANMYLRSDGYQKHEGKEDFMSNDPHPQVNTRRICVFLCTLLLESEDPGSMPTPQVRRPCSKLICLTLRSFDFIFNPLSFHGFAKELQASLLKFEKKKS